MSLEDHQIPYDSIDPQVDSFWESNGSALPAEISFSRLLDLAESNGSSEEEWAVRHFVERVSPETRITTIKALDINREALETVADMTEASSAERNATMALEYPLVLSSLARRLIWRSGASPGSTSAAITQCAGQAIESFVKNPAPHG